jgi:hypothetical protein
MKANHNTPSPPSSSRQSARLRAAGIIVLALGLAGAALVYCMGTPAEDYSDDPFTAQAYKKELRDTEVNFGKTGLIVNDLWADLGRPDTQAVLISASAILAAAGCFYFARLLDQDLTK